VLAGGLHVESWRIEPKPPHSIDATALLGLSGLHRWRRVELAFRIRGRVVTLLLSQPLSR
jgi:hypothetical protein